jgi:hypothetical protein
MKMKNLEGEVVVVVSLVGEIVARLKEVKDGSVVLTSPRLFVPAQENNSGGLAPGISMSGKQDLDEAEILFGGVVSVIPAHEQISSAWVEATSGIII